MELYIRSQDKMKLVSNCNLYISNEIRNEYVIEDLSNKYLKLGTYKTKERALEVLDEIQNKFKSKYIVELIPLVHPKKVEAIEKYLNDKYIGDFIMQPQQTKIHSVNEGVIIYEMPEE